MKYFFANWKMYLSHQQSLELLDQVVQLPPLKDGVVAYFPNDLAMKYAVDTIGGNHVGAQNISVATKGAYTGATSAELYKEVGATYTLVGHSERRSLFGETDREVNTKVKACINAGLIPIICIGESEQDNNDNKTKEILANQLQIALSDIDSRTSQIFIAYEPIWAIGTGRACLPQEVQEVAEFISEQTTLLGIPFVKILYGGSVNPQNISSYTSLDIIDGVLVGSASTTVASLNQMLEIIT